MEFEFMSADTVLPPCMPLPAAMLRLPISSTAKVMYARLLNTTLTAGIEDSNGILFVRFPIMELAAALSRSPVTVKRSLKELEDIGLILRVRRGVEEIPNVQVGNRYRFTSNPDGVLSPSAVAEIRSEERRVGKECRSRWSPYH